MRSAFSPIQNITDKTVFLSSDVKKVVREGKETLFNRDILLIDAPATAGATIAVEVLKYAARAQENVKVVDIHPDDCLTIGRLLKGLVARLGGEPKYHLRERESQLYGMLFDMATQGKRMLLCVDDGQLLPPKLWIYLKHMANWYNEGVRCGPAVTMVISTSGDKRALRWKPREMWASKGRDKIVMLGLTIGEVKAYLEFQASREPQGLHKEVLVEVEERVWSNEIAGEGEHVFPGVINQIGREVMRKRYDLDLPIHERIEKKASNKPVAAGVER